MCTELQEGGAGDWLPLLLCSAYFSASVCSLCVPRLLKRNCQPGAHRSTGQDRDVIRLTALLVQQVLTVERERHTAKQTCAHSATHAGYAVIVHPEERSCAPMKPSV